MSVRIGIVGYGNLARGVIANLKNFPDIRLEAVFTRRPGSVECAYPVFAYEDIPAHKGEIDVMVMCGGSATDLPAQSPEVLKSFCTVDSFDTHARIPEFFAVMDKTGREAGTLGAISIGWDPGLFSLARALFGAFLPSGQDYTFWGRGVSQGHSDAIRRVKGVRRGVQYTIPVEAAVERVRRGENPVLTARDKHLRECFVVAEEGADRTAIEREIKTMPNYFADYDTVVHFITEAEFEQNHTAIPHGGFVMRSGNSDPVTKHLLELKITLGSNPQFTSAVLLAYARAVKRMYDEGRRGAVTVLDVPPAYLSHLSPEELRATLL